MLVRTVQLQTNKLPVFILKQDVWKLFCDDNIIGTFFKRVNYQRQLLASLSGNVWHQIVALCFTSLIATYKRLYCHTLKFIFRRWWRFFYCIREILAKLKLNKFRKEVILIVPWYKCFIFRRIYLHREMFCKIFKYIKSDDVVIFYCFFAANW